jgi:hypothetical protein
VLLLKFLQQQLALQKAGIKSGCDAAGAFLSLI